jgi:hypothetical protein
MAIFVVVGLIVLAVIAYAIYTQVHARPSFTIATESEAPTGTGEQSQEPFNEEDSAAQMIRLDLIDQLARTYFGQEQGAQGTQDDLKLLQKLTDKFLDTPMRDAVLVAAARLSATSWPTIWAWSGLSPFGKMASAFPRCATRRQPLLSFRYRC